MAKKATKAKTIVEFLEERIKKLEGLIVERNGTVPMDFDKLIRYQTVLQFYKKEATL